MGREKGDTTRIYAQFCGRIRLELYQKYFLLKISNAAYALLILIIAPVS
jgi:hypothetical protein